MNYREISRTLGAYLYFLAAALLVPLGVALYFQFIASPETHPQPHSALAFGITFAVCLAVAFLLRFLGRKGGSLYRREGLAIVSLIWFITALIGALPFLLSGTLEDPVDAYFEAMSGLTTTGASVITPKAYNDAGEEVPIVREVPTFPPTKYVYFGTVAPVEDLKTGELLVGVEAVSQALLFWRSFLQWLGGMGIVVLFLAILPALGVGGKVLYQAEMPGPVKDALTPRIRDTARMLWKVYIGLTVLEIALLMFTNSQMSLFDATTIALSTVSTGGFSIKNASIGYYNSVGTELTVMLFMILGAVNFGHYASLLRGKLRRLKEPEMFTYLSLLLVGTLIVSYTLIGTKETLLTDTPPSIFTKAEGLRYGSFQFISLMTSTGFITANFNYWPFLCQVLLLTAMYIGGMSGSTAGGIKIIRHNITFRALFLKLETIFRPQTVRRLRIGGTEISDEQKMTVLTFIFVVISLTLLGVIILVSIGVDPETALTVNGCMLNNIGQAFRMAGPAGTFAFLSPFGKLVCILWMVLGRLEFFALLIAFRPGFWTGR
jgi:trk/ktr system potassium uptake protein